ncbi:hypothetical protein Tcan_17271 [Toxocara canis]|uniref:Uncharacterized protein n=1 Tax=Toxocara canis TaxID=6265 RepID=A0A0B2VJF4_TOXCA|nr:hypothetical protein Tcan_17271 [Toxocara canis]
MFGGSKQNGGKNRRDIKVMHFKLKRRRIRQTCSNCLSHFKMSINLTLVALLPCAVKDAIDVAARCRSSQTFPHVHLINHYPCSKSTKLPVLERRTNEAKRRLILAET